MKAGYLGSFVLVVAVLAAGAALAAWKRAEVRAEQEAASAQPEPMESVTTAVAQEREHVRTTTAIGTVRNRP